MKDIYSKLRYELSRSCDLNRGFASKIDRLVKLKLSTEDDYIIQGIDDIIRRLNEVKRLKSINMPGKCGMEFKAAKDVMENLASYCKTQLDSGEPEWMILARRHGWSPPQTPKINYIYTKSRG